MLQALFKICGEENVKPKEPLSHYTTFKIGGAADVLVLPQTVEQLAGVLRLAQAEALPITVIGNGSNLLIADSGLRGIVVCTKSLQKISVDGNVLTAACGASMAALATVARQNGLSGLEFVAGIPGTVGGGVVMNAGAYGGSISDCAVRTVCMDRQGNLQTFCGAEQNFGYRKSAFSNGEFVVLETVFSLQKGEPEVIADTIKMLNLRRKEKQPLTVPSAGSTFKRPEGYFAGKLIEDAGLKGYRVGGASVSEKHAGFVVNDQDGTCADVLAVIRHCRQVVLEKFGVRLEPEVRILGEMQDENLF